jgi:ubiquitin-protein ligase E3 C
MYSHYLLLTPDDEFFAPAINPFSLDEVTELSTIWRDLAYWAYMSGVDDTSSPGRKMGNDDERGLITRAIVRVAERKCVQSTSVAQNTIDVAVLGGPSCLKIIGS